MADHLDLVRLRNDIDATRHHLGGALDEPREFTMRAADLLDQLATAVDALLARALVPPVE
ncbi:hypothetical protein SEA_SISKO_80 [Gordonia phage Sisko]|nr:hypothetical protein SEA_ANCLAR_77 [Gordonia phage AnClar]WIC90062.1 hypothetical protein SEA_SISKO_80 [Gordonia phage Sisko]